MLKCEGYKMFRGSVVMTPVNGKPPITLHGVWLFRPDLNMWFVNECSRYPLGTSFYPNELSDFTEDE